MKKAKHTPKREKQTRYLSQAIQLEEAVNPHIIRATMSMVSLALLAFIGWAGFTNINEIARTPGEVIPQGYQQRVQHLEGGIVKTIHVHDGKVVKAGENLITLDDAIIKEDYERAQTMQLFLKQQAERLRAFRENRQPDFSQFSEVSERSIADQTSFFVGMLSAREKETRIIDDQITQKKQSIQSLRTSLSTAQQNMKIAKDMYERRRQLNSKGYASDMQLLNDERALNEVRGEIGRLQNQIIVAQTEIAEYETRLSSLSARHQDEASEKLDQILGDLAQNTELVEKLEERMGRLEIRAPVEGLVKGLEVNTVGAVIQPGQTLLEIVPLDRELEVSVKISPKDIGHLEIGQPVQLKFSTFDFSRYGSVQGELEYISPTTFTAEDGQRYYKGRVGLMTKHVGSNPQNTIIPGMTVMADIITGEKTILQYMLKPIHLSLKTAFTER